MVDITQSLPKIAEGLYIDFDKIMTSNYEPALILRFCFNLDKISTVFRTRSGITLLLIRD